MKFISDDGKEFSDFDECFSYEAKLKDKIKNKDIEDCWARIQNDVMILNNEILNYLKLNGCGKNIVIPLSINEVRVCR